METASFHHTPNTYPDEAVVNMLARPDVQAGITGVSEATSAYYNDLQERGTRVEPIISGVTQDGACIDIAKLTGGEPDAKADYSVFAYPLESVTQEGFAASLAPRKVAAVEENRGVTEVAIEDPTRFDTVYHMGIDPDGRNIVKSTEQVPAIQTIYLSRGQAFFAGTPVRSFPEAALGERRHTIVEAETKPLLEAARQRESSFDQDQLNAVVKANTFRALKRQHPDSPTVTTLLKEAEADLHRLIEKSEAASQRLRALAATMMKNAVNDPTSVDSPTLVRNPEKAEAMAYAAKPHMDKAQKSWLRKGTHQKRAKTAVDAAARHYDYFRLRHRDY